MAQNQPSPAFPFAAEVAFHPGDIVFATDRFGCVVYWNKEAEAISGYPVAEVLGKPYTLACRMEPDAAPLDLSAILAGHDFAGGIRCHSRSGTDVALYLFATAGRSPAGQPGGVVFVGRDVSGLWQAGEAAQASADKYRVLFEHTLDAVAIADMDGRVREANPACLRLYGYTADEVKGRKLVNVAAPEDRNMAAAAMANLAAGRQVTKTLRVRRKDGTRFVVDLVASVVAIGGERRIVSVTRDVTDRVRAEQARSQSERMYRTVFESANDAVFIESVDGRILDVNRNGCELLGYTKDELTRRRVPDLVPAEARDWLPRVADAILRDGTFRTEAVRVHKRGRHIPVDISASTMELDGRTVILSIVRDITQRKLAEQALRESEEKFRTVAEQSPNMIFINARGRVAYANQKSADVMGYAREEFYAPDFDFMRLIAPESAEQIKAVYARHAHGEEAKPYEYTLVTKDGRRIESLITTKLIDYDGTKAILGIVTDITERVKADSALREEKDRSQRYLALAGAILLTLDTSGRVTLLNRRGCQVLGVTEAEVLGRDWFETFVPERFRAQVRTVFAELMAGNLDPVEHYVNPVLTAGGEERLIAWHNALLHDEQGRPNGVLSSGEDVTDREKALVALLESEEKYRSVVERASDGICIVQEGRLRYVNPRLAEMVGYKPDELVGREFMEYVYTDDRQTVADRYRRRLAGEAVPSTYSVRFLPRGGGEVSVEANVRMATFNGAPAEIVLVRDVTERARAVQALRESEENFRSLAAGIRDGVATTDTAGRFTFVNDVTVERSGRPREWWLGRHHTDTVPPEHRERLERVFAAVLRGEKVEPYELSYVAADGRTVYIEANAASIRKNGVIVGAVAVNRDVTERKAVEQALRESERQYRTALDAMRDPVHVADANLRIVMANQAFAAWLRENGFDDAVLGKTVFEAFPFLPDRVREEYRRVFGTGEPVVTEEETAVAGRTIATETTKTPVTEHGTVVRVLTAIRDVTERRRLARIAEETADELRAVLDNSPGAIAGECEGVLVYANQGFARLFGYDSPAEVIGRAAAEFDAPEDRDLLTGYTRMREQGEDAPSGYSFHGLRRDGTILPLEATISTYRSLGRLHILAFIREAAPSR